MAKNLDNFITIKGLDFIKSICDPLKALGIGNFHHDITFGKGEISMLTTEPEIFRLYYNKRLPAICTDITGRTITPGIYTEEVLMTNYKDCAVVLPSYVSKFNPTAKKLILIIENERDCQHTYTLFPEPSGTVYSHWLINNITSIKNSIEHYKILAKTIIHDAKQNKNRFTLPFFTEATDKFESPICENGVKFFHKENNIPIHLSKQQSLCLWFLMQGKSAKEIGVAMQLSFRTVEHYLARIRKLLDCRSNKDLIISYKSQLSLNEYSPHTPPR